VWDVFFNEGNKILFRVGLALLKANEKQLLETEDDNSIYAMLKTIPTEAYNCDSLLGVCLAYYTSINYFPDCI
jgi:hypothetical protein